MRFKPRSRPTKREVAQAMNYLAASSGKGPTFAVRAPSIRKPSDPTKVLERHVLAAGLKYLRHHPKVVSTERTQSGVFVEGNRTIRVGFVGKLDISGVLVGGRAYEFEAKRPGGKLSPAQAERIAFLQRNGVLTGVFESVDDLARLMENA